MIAAPITLSQALERVALERPHAQAFVAPGERHDWRTMCDQARHIARALHAAGVRHGDHVGVLLGNSGMWVQIFYACAMLGAVTVPVNTRFKTEELEFCLKQADVKLLLTADTFLGIDFLALLSQVEPALDRANGLPGERLPRLRQVVVLGDRCPPGARSWHDFLAAGNAVDDAQLQACVQAVTPDDVLLIQYTSGTTSFPKGVMLTHANMLTNAWAAAQRIGVNADDRYFSIRPYFHVAGTTLSILVSLVTGCCLLTLPKFEVADALQMLDAERCTLTSGNDTIFLMLMGHPDFDRSRIHLRGGWAAAGPQVMQKIRDVMGVAGMCNAYGQSEASPNITLSSHDDPFVLRAAGWALPHPGMEVRVVDPGTGVPVAVGEAGEIQARGWSVMKGYYNMPEATARALSEDGWLSTGDRGEMDAAGRLRMVGRLKDMFRVGGENVAPAEVEEVLHAHPAVRMAQVVGVPDARLGEVPAAFVLLKDGRECTADELTAWCKQRCANYKVPRHVAVVDSFEHIGMTGSSKVQKNKLRAHAIALFGLEQIA
ncbi:AMP-binding protein [Achromobacter marplatensis]|uniref:Fatty-acyl-CoA synthase n=1 Tax=Achromobacter marplatensis TaxID=470868 RepID=A0ABX9G6M9_9BURK|nr:AMP-binding protein [Achromobacter marplatensis]RBP17472.1 fatty-acyl-CoA synthase [Achromobacter marplatensis]CAB3713926.1 3-[(3aS,4S,7aS)-7a-methyl-1, 5-dioxo-octahydro-1H-inden-4-yl]propanoyl:CoA ligase [Achromobacter marplatensis]